MNAAAAVEVAAPAPAPTSSFYRHRLPVRLMHWINVVCMTVLLMSGLNIFNAHPALYWGKDSNFDRPWVAMTPREVDGRLVGVTSVGGRRFDTTGVLGVSDGQPRGFPAWATLPSYRSLAEGRSWHLATAWVFAINGALYLAWLLVKEWRSGRM